MDSSKKLCKTWKAKLSGYVYLLALTKIMTTKIILHIDIYYEYIISLKYLI